MSKTYVLGRQNAQAFWGGFYRRKRNEITVGSGVSFSRSFHTALVFENENFDAYLEALAEGNLAVARLMASTSNPIWKVDVEMIEPVPSERIAILLSKADIVVARPKDEVAQYSSYLVYMGGAFVYEAELEIKDGDVKLRPHGGL